MISIVLDFLFPKRCVGCRRFGRYICDVCFSSISFNVIPICPVCNKNSIDGAVHGFCRTRYSLDSVTGGVVYSGIVRKLVYQFKYKPYLHDLKRVISRLLYEALVQNEVFYSVLQKKPIVLAVPIHKKREKIRGYNHAALLAEIIARKFDLKYKKDVLIRIKDTKAQFKLKREERIENVKGAFVLDKKFEKTVEGKTFLLVDDVATSCSTLNECAHVLKRNGAEFVWAVTFARES